jgi:hypothetical protein
MENQPPRSTSGNSANRPERGGPEGIIVELAERIG